MVMRRPVKPKDAVHAGNMQVMRFMTTIIAKLSQKDRPIDPPTMPVDRVATAMLALSLRLVSHGL